MNHQAFLALGSNMGDPEKNIQRTLREINKQAGKIQAVSNIYRTKPLSTPDKMTQAPFLNLVLELKTQLSPEKLLQTLQMIERSLGRDREQELRWGPRVIDIDIIIYDKLIQNNPGLTIPHPEMLQRDFVLCPLHEIAPEQLLPHCDQSLSELIEHLPASSKTILEVKGLHTASWQEQSA